MQCPTFCSHLSLHVRQDHSGDSAWLPWVLWPQAHLLPRFAREHAYGTWTGMKLSQAYVKHRVSVVYDIQNLVSDSTDGDGQLASWCSDACLNRLPAACVCATVPWLISPESPHHQDQTT
jgi:hypothetical protein